MDKRMKKMLLVIGIIFGGLIIFNSIKHVLMNYYFNHYKIPTVTVSAAKTEQIDWYPYFASVGSFVAINGVDVTTQSAGKITAIHFNSGQYVEKNSPLVDIDDSVEQALLKFYQADLIFQKTNYQRQADLVKRNATAISNVDEARAKMQQAEANVENTQATINLKHIKAPFTGSLGIRQIDLGQFLQPGVTTIAPLQSLDPIYLNFYIPEQYITRIRIGQMIIFNVEQSPGINFKGQITAINSKIDEKTHNIQVQATIENCPALHTKQFKQSDFIQERKALPDGREVLSCSSTVNHDRNIQQFNFIPGMFATIEIVQPVKHDVIVVPSTAVSYTMYGDSVFVIEASADEKMPATVKRVYITAGETRGNYTVIKKGLSANQLIVSAGEMKLQDGTPVVIDSNNVLVDHADIDALGE
jgi:membrane fusion protein (multidrug efflux system)